MKAGRKLNAYGLNLEDEENKKNMSQVFLHGFDGKIMEKQLRGQPRRSHIQNVQGSMNFTSNSILKKAAKRQRQVATVRMHCLQTSSKIEVVIGKYSIYSCL